MNESLFNQLNPPFETVDLRSKLKEFFDLEFLDSHTGKKRSLGSFQWGVYAFFDYEQEPIYVGQTKEKISTRIRRHLTNQRTDAVAMSVLDPFEVLEIEVWPLPQFEGVSASNVEARRHLDALENLVYREAIHNSKFSAILNEKEPPVSNTKVSKPTSKRFQIVSEKVFEIRSHPDFRIARRALIISKLAQVISERKVQPGLRNVLVTQSKRLNWLAEQRHNAMSNHDAEIDDV
ncbi:GIY-YIG nuclease family protein [Paracoccaceae bacterium]|nr:GIY-YIG nuclease family protein [Paracoccaceae bacterium]